MIFKFKAQFKMKKFVIPFIMILFSGFYTSLMAQCGSKIFLGKIIATSSNVNQGSIEVHVECSGKYTAELYNVTGAGRIIIQKLAGLGSQSLIFDGLKPGDNYQVLVIFDDEEQKLCKKRQISEISTLKK